MTGFHGLLHMIGVHLWADIKLGQEEAWYVFVEAWYVFVDTSNPKL